MKRIWIGLLVALCITACSRESNWVQVSFRVAPSPPYPELLRWAGWPAREIPSAVLEHDCYLVNVWASDIVDGVAPSSVPSGFDGSCLKMGNLSQAVSLSTLTNEGVTLTARAGSARTIELLGVSGSEGNCSTLTPANWFSPKPIRVHTLATATENLTKSREVTLYSSYTSTAPDERLAPCSGPVAINSIDPVTGGQGGGTVITVTGTGFFPDPDISIGGNRCRHPNLISSTEVQCVAPAVSSRGIRDVRNVVVANRGASHSDTLPNGYTYTSPPINARNFYERNPVTTEGLFKATDADSSFPRIIGVDDRLWVAWLEDTTKLYLMSFNHDYTDPKWTIGNSGVAISTSASSRVEGTHYLGRPLVAFNESGQARVGYLTEGDTFEFIDGGGLNTNGSSSKVDVVNHSGTLYAAWIENDGSTEDYVRLARYEGGGTWTQLNTQSQLNKTASSESASDADIELNGDKVFVVWTEVNSGFDQLYASYYDINGNSFSGISPSLNDNSSVNSSYPHLASDGMQISVAWSETSRIRVQEWVSDTTWSPLTAAATAAIQIANPALLPRLAWHGSTLYVAFHESGVPEQTYVLDYSGSGTAWPNTLGTAVNSNPTRAASHTDLGVVGDQLIQVFAEDPGDTDKHIRVTVLDVQ